MPPRLTEAAGMDRQVRVQDAVAQKLKERRHQQGAMDLESIEPRPVFDGENITDLQLDTKNRAKELIEDLMIAANGVTARFLETGGSRRSGASCGRPSAGGIT